MLAKQVRRFTKMDNEHCTPHHSVFSQAPKSHLIDIARMTYAEVLQFDAELRGVLSQCPSPLVHPKVNCALNLFWSRSLENFKSCHAFLPRDAMLFIFEHT